MLRKLGIEVYELGKVEYMGTRVLSELYKGIAVKWVYLNCKWKPRQLWYQVSQNGIWKAPVGLPREYTSLELVSPKTQTKFGQLS